jgi:hypothetical protein
MSIGPASAFSTHLTPVDAMPTAIQRKFLERPAGVAQDRTS